MNKRAWQPSRLLLPTILLATAVIPAWNPTPAPAQEKKVRTRTLVVEHADLTTWTGGVAVLEGHVHLREGNTHFKADRVVYDSEKDTGEAVQVPGIRGGSIGRPTASDEYNTLVADRFILDFSSKEPGKKVVSAIGNVKFDARPKPDGPAKPAAGEKPERLKDRLKEPTHLDCNRLDYYYRTKRAVATGDLKVTQGKRWFTGDQAIFYEKNPPRVPDDTVAINGNVKGEDEKGRTFAANNVTVRMTEETDVIAADRFKGTFILEEEEEEVPADEPAPVIPDIPSLSPTNPAPGDG